MYINKVKLLDKLKEFKNNDPFDHCVVDDFLTNEVIEKIEEEFLPYTDSRWYYYKNKLEDKKALNDWNVFPPMTYRLFNYLNSSRFIDILSAAVGVQLYSDTGLHGGGWHMHGPGGNLNPHLDYSLHPKTGLERKLNLIIYVSSALKENHGGNLGLWNQNNKELKPDNLIKSIAPKYNRAVIFDTTQNSWHGMCEPLTQPEGIYRKSLAVYYLIDPTPNTINRQKALFAARSDQEDDPAILELIKKRADNKLFNTVYKTED